MKQKINDIQLDLDLDPGILEQFPEFRDAVRASVYSCGRAFKSIAADLDMSVSELSRKLADNPNDPVHFPMHRMPDLITATGDVRPIYWLIARFIESKAAKRNRAIDHLSKLLPQIQSALKEMDTK
jgi:hypothetical protein